MDNAFAYDEGASTCTEDSYPYKAKNGQCSDKTCQVAIPKGGVTGHMDVQANSEEAMMSALQVGPVSVAIEADQSVFQHYSSGIIDSGCGTNLDHGVLAVGYGTENGQKYWKIKNSWGASWGDSGFVRLARPNTCGILQQASYPTVKKCDPKCCGSCECTEEELCGTDNPCCANTECCSSFLSEQCCDGGCAHAGEVCCGSEGGGSPCDAEEHCGAGTCCKGENKILPGSKTGTSMCCETDLQCGELCLEQGPPFETCCNGHIGDLTSKCCSTDNDCPFAFAGAGCCDGVCCSPSAPNCDSTNSCTRSFQEMV